MAEYADFNSDNAESTHQRQIVEAEEAAQALALLNKVPSSVIEENTEGTVIKPVVVDDTEAPTNEEEDEVRVVEETDVFPYIGYRFDPEDEELIQMLIRFIKGLKVGGNKVEVADLYSDDPSVITEKWTPSIRKETQQYLVLTPRRWMGGETEHFHRIVVGDKGYWEANGSRSYYVGPSGDIIGSSMSFRFSNGNLKNKFRGKRLTAWQMVEYSVYSELSLLNPKNLVICKVFENEKSATAKAGVAAAKAEEEQKEAMKVAAAVKVAAKILSEKYEAAKNVEAKTSLVAESSKSQALKKLGKRDKELKKAFEKNEKEKKLDEVRKEKELATRAARLAKRAAVKQKKLAASGGDSTSGTGRKVNVKDGDANDPCGKCGEVSKGGEFWIYCDVCKLWYHGDSVEVTKAQSDTMEEYYCPSCTKEQIEGGK